MTSGVSKHSFCKEQKYVLQHVHRIPSSWPIILIKTCRTKHINKKENETLMPWFLMNVINANLELLPGDTWQIPMEMSHVGT